LWLIPGVSAATFDHSKFDQVLKKYVDDKGLVDYNSIAKDKRFAEYMQSLQTARVEEFPRDGQLAFWINAYNAVTIDKVIKKKPKKSVRETFVPGVWTGTKFFTSREHVADTFCHNLCFHGLSATAEDCLYGRERPDQVGGGNAKIS
jgi:hypothetical protein